MHPIFNRFYYEYPKMPRTIYNYLDKNEGIFIHVSFIFALTLFSCDNNEQWKNMLQQYGWRHNNDGVSSRRPEQQYILGLFNTLSAIGVRG